MFEENIWGYDKKAFEYDAWDEIDQEIGEIFTDLTNKILEEFSIYGKKKDIPLIAKYLVSDSFAKYHTKQIANCFSKIDKQFATDFLVNMLCSNHFQMSTLESSKTMLALLLELEEVEKIRNILNEQIEKFSKEYSIEPELQGTLNELRSLITPSSDKTAITNLQDFYQKNIRFEEYEVNKKMNEKEVSLLKSLMRKDQKILEMGCGTGRLILEMKKAGYNISGFDFTERHVNIVKKENPDLEVFQADWHDTKLPDQSQDVIYSLGRNSTHDYSFIDQVATFREANHLLKPGGKFIFDIANREEGGYKKMVEGYAEEMEKRGIKNFRYGSIYDSPDGEHFSTRYAYSHDDIVMLAQLTGFEIKLVKREPLETGNGDENLYYVLEKK